VAIDFGNRLPSNKQTYDLFWSEDPAFVQGEGSEHERKLEQARETGDWSALLVQGQIPTKFVARQVPSEIRRRLLDRYSAEKIGGRELDALLVRVAIVDVVGFGDFKLGFAKHEDWGRVASSELVDAMDAYAPGSITELALQIFNRMMGISGK
jgi:hypothetical protein